MARKNFWRLSRTRSLLSQSVNPRLSTFSRRFQFARAARPGAEAVDEPVEPRKRGGFEHSQTSSATQLPLRIGCGYKNAGIGGLTSVFKIQGNHPVTILFGSMACF